MSNNIKQQKLIGIEATMNRATMTDTVFELVDQVGLTTLANELEIDKASLSRFRSGEAGLTLEKLDKLLNYGEVVIIQKARYKRLVDTIITLSELTKEGLGL
ncbi:MAG: hypothetical protein H8D67_14780 [Deltaproteobacteria bacterium]|nr:hypothetical protein [Deltaproteobacteria bacterium]